MTSMQVSVSNRQKHRETKASKNVDQSITAPDAQPIASKNKLKSINSEWNIRLIWIQ